MAEASFLLIGLPACLKRPTGRLAAAADEGHAIVCLEPMWTYEVVVLGRLSSCDTLVL